MNEKESLENANNLANSTEDLIEQEEIVVATGCFQIPTCCRCRTDRLVGFISAIWHLMTGIERATIIPTLWLFLESLEKDSAHIWYGLVLGAFGISVLFSTPIFGYLASQGYRIKILLIISNLFEIVGNFIYFIAKSPTTCFIGRFIAGIGVGCEPALYSDLVRATLPKERTHYVIGLALGKELGIVIGPVLTLLFVNLNVKVTEDFSINIYNMPGLMMTILWAVHTILLIWYPVTGIDGKLVDMKNKSFKNFFVDESIARSRYGDRNSGCCANLGIYKNYSIIIMLLTIFAANFNSMCLEAFLPALATTRFGWTEKEISYTYIGAFGLLLLSTILFFVITKNLDDRVSLLAAFFVMGVGYIIMIIGMVIMKFTDYTSPIIALALISVGLHSCSMPGVITLPESLYTKLAPVEDVERAQTFSRLVVNVSLFLGLYLGGSLSFLPTIISAIMAILAFLPSVLILVKYDRFKTECYANIER